MDAVDLKKLVCSPEWRICLCISCRARQEIESLRDQLAEEQADAARYRWLVQERYVWSCYAVTHDSQVEQVAMWVKPMVQHISAAVDAERLAVSENTENGTPQRISGVKE